MRNKILVFLVLTAALSASGALAIKATIDPSELAVGSRSLGLGRAYVALADDVSTLFQNPAGIAALNQWQLTSLAANLLGEIQYAQFGGTLSLGSEAVGIGYVGASIGGSLLSRRDPVTNRIVPTGAGAIGYNSSVILLSGATRRLKNLYLGYSLKIFSQELIGVPGGNVSALGQDLDLGAKYLPLSWLNLGICLQNILPCSSGGRLMWGSGISESIPATVKLGTAFKLVGPGALREFRVHKLTLAYDYEFFPRRANRPPLSHLGLEWLPWEELSLRIGLDQDAVATGGGGIGIDNNLAAGVGVSFYGVRLDYAFHTFGGLAENNTHFFSLSFGAPEKKPGEAFPSVISKEVYLKVVSPPDNFITFDATTLVSGEVLKQKDLQKVVVNQIPVGLFLYPNVTFAAAIPLNLGRNTIEVEAVSQTGRIIDTHKKTVFRLKRFSDVPASYENRETLGFLAALGYVNGFPTIVGFVDGTFKPNGFITQRQLLTLLSRIAKTPYPLRGSNKYVTRAEAVAMILRFAGLEEPKYIYEEPFTDIKTRHWAARAIIAAKNEGWLKYIKDKRFRPNQKITRLEIIDILAKTQPVKKIISEIQNPIEDNR